jgi:GLPGLI family protein
MKAFFLGAIVLIYCTQQLQAQTITQLKATYTIRQTVMDIPLTSVGYLYVKGNKTIYYEEPDYLEKYPDGKIPNPKFPGRFIQRSTVAKQNIRYFDQDSLRVRYSINNPGMGSQNSTYLTAKVRPSFWEFHDKTKVINGLTCQLATLKNVYNDPQWEVWFCPDIPVSNNLDGIYGLPGLVIEGYNVQLKTTYVLQEFNTQSNFADEVFWPKEFNQPFQDLGYIVPNPKPGSRKKSPELERLLLEHSNQGN